MRRHTDRLALFRFSKENSYGKSKRPIESMLTLYLVRHGQTDFNAQRRVQGQFDSELDDTGRQQAEALRPELESLGIDFVYSSSSLRTRQTTDILATNLKCDVVYQDELREIYMGDWQQRLWDDVEKEEPEQYRYFMTQPHLFNQPGTETFQQLQDRGAKAVNEIVARHNSGNALIVSHGAMIKATLAHFAGVKLSRMWEEPLLSNCSVSVIEVPVEPRVPALRLVGGHPFKETSWFTNEPAQSRVLP